MNMTQRKFLIVTVFDLLKDIAEEISKKNVEDVNKFNDFLYDNTALANEIKAGKVKPKPGANSGYINESFEIEAYLKRRTIKAQKLIPCTKEVKRVGISCPEKNSYAHLELGKYGYNTKEAMTKFNYLAQLFADFKIKVMLSGSEESLKLVEEVKTILTSL